MTALDDATSIPDERLPFHLRGNYAPVTTEIEAFDLPVLGALPEQLSGRYFRNGANPKHGPSAHWFAGDGMLHGIRLRDGRAEWYRNRWVRTKALDGAARIDMSTGAMDFTVGLANTHVVRHAGQILALEEGSFPNRISPDLDTLGPYDFGGTLKTPFTAHPHTCPETGEMHFFGYELVAPPFVTYHVADAAGNLVHSQPIEVGGPTMVHDFAISRHYAIFLDLPVVFDIDLAMQGTMPFQWDTDYRARIGLLHRQRARRGEQPRWFDIDPCYVFHVMNAWESADGNVVHLDAGRHASMWQGGPDSFEPCYLHRWSFDLAAGTVQEQQLDDLSHGFPRIDDRRTGLPNRYGYTVGPRSGENSAWTQPRTWSSTTCAAVRARTTTSAHRRCQESPCSCRLATPPVKTTDTSSPTSMTRPPSPAGSSSSTPATWPQTPSPRCRFRSACLTASTAAGWPTSSTPACAINPRW